MVANLALLFSLLATLAGSQSEAATRVAAVPAAAPLSAPEAAFLAELEDLLRVRASFERAKVDGGFVVIERLPRFIELAQQGSGRAAAFALHHYVSEPGDLRRERVEKLDLYQVLERSFAGRSWLIEPELDVFVSLRRDAALLGVSRSRSLARSLREGAELQALRAQSLLAEAWIELDHREDEPSAERRARALLRELIDLYAGTSAAREAGDLLWRLDHLAVGRVAPDFVATDVDGNELRLSDWNRRVVLVEFWSFEDPRIAERLAARRQMYERFREERFVLVGINLDSQESAFRRGVEEFGIEWSNVFTGGTDERVIWKIRGPANLVLKPERVIQFVDLGEDELEQAIETLIQEGKEKGDGANGSGPPIR